MFILIWNSELQIRSYRKPERELLEQEEQEEEGELKWKLDVPWEEKEKGRKENEERKYVYAERKYSQRIYSSVFSKV